MREGGKEVAKGNILAVDDGKEAAKGNILVVDDEQEVADLLELYLFNEGYTVYKYYCGKDALSALKEHTVDLALLDIMLPDMDGFSLCREIRKDYFFPVIMVTAKVEDADKIRGLLLGADDYITKPFNPLEVVARVKSQLRRCCCYDQRKEQGNLREVPVGESSKGREQEELDIRGLIINRSLHRCELYGKELELTPREFDILWYLCDHCGQVVPSEELFEAVWKEKYFNSNNTVMAHIGRIREKMQDSYKKQKFIKTVWGVGYTIEA